MRLFPLLILTGALALAGCRGQPSEPVELNNSANAAINAAAPHPAAAAPTNNAVEHAAPPLDFTDEEQMRDDADATGLTARLPREGNGAAPAANAAAPR
jgi:hypothetical protein